MIERQALKTKTGTRVRYLSPTHAVTNITMAAKNHGGAERHREAPTPYPIPSERIMGRKYAIAYVLVVKQLSLCISIPATAELYNRH